MNYNQFSIPNKKDLPKKELCPRARLDTGTFCNYNCVFCYYKNSLDKIDSFKIIKDRIDYIKSYSLITEIELSGGESSIHPDWFKILDYCNEYFNHISTLSNGSRFNDKNFLIKSKQYGLKEILFSMHGHGEFHNTIVNRKNAFDTLIRAIENSLSENLITRINCTVTNLNYECIDKDFTTEILRLINKGITQLNFIFHNYWGDNSNSEIISYDLLSKPVVNSINIIKDIFPEFDIRIRYAPYCLFTGIKDFDKIIYGHFDHIFDKTDWNREILRGHKIENKIYSYDESLNMSFELSKISRLHSYFKPLECVKCSFFKDCDGIENQLINTQKVIPI